VKTQMVFPHRACVAAGAAPCPEYRRA